MRLITIRQLILLPLGMIALSTTLLYFIMHGFTASVLSSKSSQKEMKHETQMVSLNLRDALLKRVFKTKY
jgi:hypothetical protein